MGLYLAFAPIVVVVATIKAVPHPAKSKPPCPSACLFLPVPFAQQSSSTRQTQTNTMKTSTGSTATRTAESLAYLDDYLDSTYPALASEARPCRSLPFSHTHPAPHTRPAPHTHSAPRQTQANYTHLHESYYFSHLASFSCRITPSGTPAPVHVDAGLGRQSPM